jgi:hypothetical protein
MIRRLRPVCPPRPILPVLPSILKLRPLARTSSHTRLDICAAKEEAKPAYGFAVFGWLDEDEVAASPIFEMCTLA